VVVLGRNRKGKVLALGTGFFVGQGMIATSHHVISGASRLQVKILGQTAVQDVQRVLAVDAHNDLALLSVSEVGPALRLGDSESVSVGDQIYVVGNPRGLEGTFSQGVVSGLRSHEGTRYLQITAPISPGSSGGPVLNSEGEVIGVALGSLRGGQNLNFAVPASYLMSLFGKGLPLDKRPLDHYAELRIEKRLAAVRRTPTSAEAHFELAEEYLNCWRIEEAVEAYKRAFQLRPDYFDAHLHLGKVYLMYIPADIFLKSRGGVLTTSYVNAAVECFKNAIRIKPDSAEAHYWLGSAFRRKGDEYDAVEEYKLATRLDPKHLSAFLGMGEIYLSIARWPLREKRPGPSEFIDGLLSEAIGAFTHAIRIAEGDLPRLKSLWGFATAGLGEAYCEAGKFDAALRVFKALIQSDTDELLVNTALRGMETTYYRSGRVAEGIDTFRRILETLRTSSGRARGHYHLGSLYVDARDKAAALQQYSILKGMDAELAKSLFTVIYAVP
jgi:tetratricopeptide (TPR) repeat protein